MRVTSDSGASPVTTLIDLRGRDAAGLTRPALAGVLPRAAPDVERAVELVRPVGEDVRARGAAGAGGARGTAARTQGHRAGPRPVGVHPVRPGAAGRGVRARRPRRLPVVGGDERGAR